MSECCYLSSLLPGTPMLISSLVFIVIASQIMTINPEKFCVAGSSERKDLIFWHGLIVALWMSVRVWRGTIITNLSLTMYSTLILHNSLMNLLADSVYPKGNIIPKEIEVLRDPRPAHPEYKVIVKYFVTLTKTIIANRYEKVSIIATKLSLLDRDFTSQSRFSHRILQPDTRITPENFRLHRYQ